jgi:ribonucleoside-diphosphate reductase alpha chain
MTEIPELIEDAFGVANTAVVAIPQESPEGAPTENNETALQLFERVIRYNQNWVANGHRSGANMHNVSCTITPREDEWSALGQAMWKNRELYTGISLFPFDNGSYKQAPFEPITKEKFEEMDKLVKTIDLTKVTEFENNTKLNESVACAGGACEVTVL